MFDNHEKIPMTKRIEDNAKYSTYMICIFFHGSLVIKNNSGPTFETYRISFTLKFSILFRSEDMIKKNMIHHTRFVFLFQIAKKYDFFTHMI